MSYILDALRKSEHERQMAAGQTVSLLFPQEIKRSGKPWLIPLSLLLVILIALAWWTRHNATTSPNNHPPIPAAPPPPAISTAARTEPASPPKLKKPATEYAQKKNRPSAQPASDEELSIHAAATPAATATGEGAAHTDPLKGLPALNITGYIHNQQSGSLAMINNQLVHEGDEVFPGLRLIKIIDDSAVFSYKGYVFSR